jgi:hypothetical protein
LQQLSSSLSLAAVMARMIPTADDNPLPLAESPLWGPFSDKVVVWSFLCHLFPARMTLIVAAVLQFMSQLGVLQLPFMMESEDGHVSLNGTADETKLEMEHLKVYDSIHAFYLEFLQWLVEDQRGAYQSEGSEEVFLALLKSSASVNISGHDLLETFEFWDESRDRRLSLISYSFDLDLSQLREVRHLFASTIRIVKVVIQVKRSLPPIIFRSLLPGLKESSHAASFVVRFLTLFLLLFSKGSIFTEQPTSPSPSLHQGGPPPPASNEAIEVYDWLWNYFRSDVHQKTVVRWFVAEEINSKVRVSKLNPREDCPKEWPLGLKLALEESIAEYLSEVWVSKRPCRVCS